MLLKEWSEGKNGFFCSRCCLHLQIKRKPDIHLVFTFTHYHCFHLQHWVKCCYFTLFPGVGNFVERHSFWIKSILINEYQHKSTRINMNQHESTRVNTNQQELHTSQHEPDRSQHESTRIRHESTRINTSQLDQEMIIVYRSLVGKLW